MRRRTNRTALQVACAVATAIAAHGASAGIITDGFVVVDADFNQHDVPIGPNDTNTGPDLGVFSLSSGPTGTTLIVDGGSRLTTGRLVTGSTPSGAPAQITISGAGSTIELLGAQQAGRSAIDFASQGTSTLTISGGGQLTFSPTASACTQTSQFGVGPICTVVNIGNAAGSTATVVVTGAGSRLDLDPENLDPDTFHITQIGGAVVTQSGFGTPGGSSLATVSVLNGATFETDFASVAPAVSRDGNTGTESVTSLVTISGTGSTWNSNGIVIGNRVDPDGVPVPPTAPQVSGTVIVANGGVINSDVNVYADGVLGGNGTLVGTIYNSGGVVSPGLSPGVLTIVGDFLMDAGQLLIEIAGLGAGEFDLLDVSGLIDITGGEILLSFLDGFAFTPGQVLPFLTAGAGISIGADMTFAFSGVPDDFTLELDRTSGTLITRLVSVPEPSTLGLLAIGVAALCLGAAHRRAARGKRSIAEL